MARVVSLANQKGGVGKTTTTISLGAAIAEHGNRVLLVDFDPQGALSVGMGINSNGLELTIYNVLLDRSVDPASVIIKTSTPNVDLLPANIDLSAAEVVLVSEVAREQALKRALTKIQDRYDYILIDCQPSLGLLTINALTASDSVIIPLECEFFALRGMALLVDTIEKIRDRLNPALELQGIVATMYDARTLHSREVLARVREAFGDKLFNTVINRTIRFAEAPVAGLPILAYAPDSPGATAYRNLAKEVLGIVDDQTSELAGSRGAVPEHNGDAPGTGSSTAPIGGAAGDPGASEDAGHAGPTEHAGTREPSLFDLTASPDASPGLESVAAASQAASGEPELSATEPTDANPAEQRQAGSAEVGERTDPPRGEGDLLLRP